MPPQLHYHHPCHLLPVLYLPNDTYQQITLIPPHHSFLDMLPINSITNLWNTHCCSLLTLISATLPSSNIEITAIPNNLMEIPMEILTYINNTPKTLTEDTHIM